MPAFSRLPFAIRKVFLSYAQRPMANGFSLIELMIVISLFAIITIMATISYISFEGGQRLKNGALQIKNDLRLAQSSAQSGDKGAGSCNAISGKLVGWYLTFDTTSTNNTLYKIAGDCQTGAGDDSLFSETTMNLPTGVTISSLVCGSTTYTSGTSDGGVSVVFKPLDYNVIFFINSATAPIIPVDFTDNTTGLFRTGITGCSELVVTLSSSDGTYLVKINSAGKIYESKT